MSDDECEHGMHLDTRCDLCELRAVEQQRDDALLRLSSCELERASAVAQNTELRAQFQDIANQTGQQLTKLREKLREERDSSVQLVKVDRGQWKWQASLGNHHAVGAVQAEALANLARYLAQLSSGDVETTLPIDSGPLASGTMKLHRKVFDSESE